MKHKSEDAKWSETSAFNASKHIESPQQRAVLVRLTCQIIRQSNTHYGEEAYVVYKYMRYTGIGNNIEYVLSWYDFTPLDDSAEPTYCIPEHFITSFCQHYYKKL